MRSILVIQDDFDVCLIATGGLQCQVHADGPVRIFHIKFVEVAVPSKVHVLSESKLWWCRFRVNFRGIGLSIIDTGVARTVSRLPESLATRELVFASVHGIGIEAMSDELYTTLDFHISDVQIDDQRASASHPIVLARVRSQSLARSQFKKCNSKYAPDDVYHRLLSKVEVEKSVDVHKTHALPADQSDAGWLRCSFLFSKNHSAPGQYYFCKLGFDFEPLELNLNESFISSLFYFGKNTSSLVARPQESHRATHNLLPEFTKASNDLLDHPIFVLLQQKKQSVFIEKFHLGTFKLVVSLAASNSDFVPFFEFCRAPCSWGEFNYSNYSAQGFDELAVLLNEHFETENIRVPYTILSRVCLLPFHRVLCLYC
jgi:hypothetical protein